MALNESIECIATLIDSNFIYRAFYYKREKEIQLTVCAKEVSSREEKSVDIFGFFASENEDRKKARRLCCVPGSGRTTEYCSELVTLRKTKKVWQELQKFWFYYFPWFWLKAHLNILIW